LLQLFVSFISPKRLSYCFDIPQTHHISTIYKSFALTQQMLHL